MIGGLRVILLTDGLALIHGPLAHAFFALVVSLALVTSSRMAHPAPAVDGATRGLALASAIVYVQIVFGALLTHAGIASTCTWPAPWPCSPCCRSSPRACGAVTLWQSRPPGRC